MAAELRWILLALSALLLAGIWWWGVRRSRQAPGNAELRESMGSAAAGHPAAPAEPSAPHEPTAEHRRNDGSRDWGVPPFEPLSIRTADFEQVQMMDLPMTAEPTCEPSHEILSEPAHEPVREPARESAFEPEYQPAHEAAHEATRVSAHESEYEPVREPTRESAQAAYEPARRPARQPAGGMLPAPELPVSAQAPSEPPAVIARSNEIGDRFTAAPQVPNASEMQRIVTIRVCAAGESHWIGTQLMAALENHGLAHGRYHVFHRKHSDGRTLFCAASLVEPGTFDIVRMPEEEFRGLTLFAVLPGPAVPVQTIDALIATARALAETLHGEVQDAKGLPLTAQRAAELREEVARFQAMMAT